MPRKTSTSLTVKFIDNIKPAATRQEIPDADCTGLYLMVQPSGTKGFVMRFRWQGEQCKVTLGPYGDKEGQLSLKEARAEGQKILAQLRDGINPAAAKVAATIVERDLFENVYADFLRRHVQATLKPTTARAYENMFALDIVPYWSGIAIHDIKRRDIKFRIREAMEERDITAQANLLYSRLKKFFNWCVDEEYLETSPMEKMKKPAVQVDRDRVLSDDEIRLVYLAAGQIGFPYGTIIQGLLLTAQRKSEVADAPRIEVSMGTADMPEPHWTIPKERTKNKMTQIVPLSPEMVALLDLPKLNTNPDMYFVNSRGNRLDGWSAFKKDLDYQILVLKRQEAIERGEDPATVQPIEPWVIHDLRRTVATKMGALRITPHVIEAVLNHRHVIKGVAAVYNRWDYYDEKRAALETWAKTLMRIVNPAANVVDLRAA